MIVITFAMLAMSLLSWVSLFRDSQQREHAPLALGRFLPKQLVQLDADQEDDRGRVGVPAEHEEDGEAARSGLEVEELGDKQPEDQRGGDPREDYDQRAAADPRLF